MQKIAKKNFRISRTIAAAINKIAGKQRKNTASKMSFIVIILHYQGFPDCQICYLLHMLTDIQPNRKYRL